MTVKMVNWNLRLFISESLPDFRRIMSGVEQAPWRRKLKRTNLVLPEICWSIEYTRKYKED